MSGSRIFTITKDHIKLLNRMFVTWDDCEYGAPAIDPKRPYGNSSVAFDIAEILGWEAPDESTMSDAEYDKAEDLLQDKAYAIHKEMETVLQIVCCLTGYKKITPGKYIQGNDLDRHSWGKVVEKKK